MDVLASTLASTSIEKVWWAQASMATVCRCSIMTPLGRPVEPEV